MTDFYKLYFAHPNLHQLLGGGGGMQNFIKIIKINF